MRRAPSLTSNFIFNLLSIYLVGPTLESDGRPIFPSGNALKYLGEYFDKNVDVSNPYDEDPQDIQTLSFSPTGDVLNGNVYEKDILDILEAYQP